jgi:predicted enzyme related to lactoylglutathione lyase
MTKRSFTHLDITVTENKAATLNFYKNLCGWEIFEDPQYPSAMFSSENLTGGFAPVDENNKIDSMLLYLETEDLDADIAQIESLGGSVVVPKVEVPNFGAYVIVKDPSGNRFGLWKNAPQAQG